MALLQLSNLKPAYSKEISEDDLKGLSIGMKKEKILSGLGEPNAVRPGGMVDGKRIEALEYDVAGMIDFPDEGGYVVSENTMGKNYDNQFRTPAPPKHDRQGYRCSLVIVDGSLVRVERMPKD